MRQQRPRRPQSSSRGRRTAEQGPPSEFASNRSQAYRNRPERQGLEQSTDARAIAAQILLRVEQEGAFSDMLLDGVSRRNDVSPTGKALTRQFVKGVLTNKSALDRILADRLSSGLQSLAPELLQVLRIGSYQLLFLDRAPKPLVVNESVALARLISGEGSARLTNAVLRRIVREQPSREVAAEELEGPAAIAEATSHPLWVVELWLAQFGKDETIKLCQANNRQLPTAIRINTLHSSLGEVERELVKDGVKFRRSTLAKDALVIEQLPRGIPIAQLRSFQQGHCTVQDEGSMLVSELVQPKPDETIVDLCAAPGGKTTHLATLMRDRGTVLAIDPHKRKLQSVRELAQRLGLKSIKTIESDGRTFQPREQVDAVLVDAPCSGLGMLARKADIRWQREEGSMEELLELQAALLEQAARMVKPGGRVIYSTCTIHTAENAAQVEKFLKLHPEFSLVDSKTLLPKEVVSKQGYLETLPHRHRTGGMFGAVFIRNS